MRRIVSPNKEIGEDSRYSQLSLKQQTSFIANQSINHFFNQSLFY